MGCIDFCCWGPFGARCCNVISLVGFIYFALSFLIFQSQKNFYQFHMQNPDNTKTSFLICSLLYLGFFVLTFFRIMQLGKKKKDGEVGETQKNNENAINKGSSTNQLKE